MLNFDMSKKCRNLCFQKQNLDKNMCSIKCIFSLYFALQDVHLGKSAELNDILEILIFLKKKSSQKCSIFLK